MDISELDICMHHVCDCDVLRHVYVIPVLEEASWHLSLETGNQVTSWNRMSPNAKCEFCCWCETTSPEVTTCIGVIFHLLWPTCTWNWDDHDHVPSLFPVVHHFPSKEWPFGFIFACSDRPWQTQMYDAFSIIFSGSNPNVKPGFRTWNWLMAESLWCASFFGPLGLWFFCPGHKWAYWDEWYIERG